MTPQPATTESQIIQLGDELGFAMTGIAPVSPSDWQDFMTQWLADGKHGEMDYLAQNQDLRTDPAKLLDASPPSKTNPRPPRNLQDQSTAQSVICVLDRYAHQTDLKPQEPAGRIARYAWGDDYHKVLKKRLMNMADQLAEQYPNERFRVAVDTAPILEREQALRAGLGWIGKHTLLINPKLGSWFLLGEIITTLKLTPTVDQPMHDHCGTCTRCIDACPTNCITPYQMNASKCISYLTLEHRNTIIDELQIKMDDWLAGCDICQEVCPHNRPPRKPRNLPPNSGTVSSEQGRYRGTQIHERYAPRSPAPGLNLLEVLNWNAESRQQAFMGSALKRMKLEMVKRNALIAAGNYLAKTPDENLLGRITEIAADQTEHELVSHTAQTVLNRLAKTSQ